MPCRASSSSVGAKHGSQRAQHPRLPVLEVSAWYRRLFKHSSDNYGSPPTLIQPLDNPHTDQSQPWGPWLAGGTQPPHTRRQKVNEHAGCRSGDRRAPDAQSPLQSGGSVGSHSLCRPVTFALTCMDREQGSGGRPFPAPEMRSPPPVGLGCSLAWTERFKCIASVCACQLTMGKLSE